MSSKEFKVNKKSKKKKLNLKNVGQQVFVLPPNLLQKLGINLESMESTPVFSDMGCKMSNHVPNHNHGHSSSTTDHEINSNIINNETSITKTATLMKESVFLSPTFNTSNVNNATGSQIGEYIEVCNGDITCESRKNKLVRDKLKTSRVVSDQGILNRKLESNHNDNSCDVNLSIENDSLEINDSISQECVVRNKTINVISEESVTVEKLNELKVFELSSKTMIPTSLNATIGKSKIKDLVVQPQKFSISTKGATNDTDLQFNKSNSKLIRNDGEMSKIETIAKIDSHINNNTNNFSNSASNENHMLNFEANEASELKYISNKDIEPSVSEDTDLNKSFYKDQITLSNITNTECLDAFIVEKETDVCSSQNNFAVVNMVIDTEVMTVDHNFTETIESPMSNKHYEMQPTNDNNKLEAVKIDDRTKIDDGTEMGHGTEMDDGTELDDGTEMDGSTEMDDGIEIDDVTEIDDGTENTECYPPYSNTNNNMWDQNESDVDKGKLLMLKNTTNIDNHQQKNNETNTVKGAKDSPSDIEETFDFINSSIEQNHRVIDSEKCTHVTLKTINNNSFDGHEIPVEIINDNMTSLTDDLKLVKKQYFSTTIVDGGISKLSLPFNPNRNNFMSKLCIQGVEKPGGINLDPEKTIALKTYTNNNKKHKICGTHETIFDVKLDHNSNIDLNETGTLSLLPCQQFCTCCDYGILDYSQIENSYEHIHFSTRKSLDCSPDVVFGIYGNEIVNIEETREDHEHTVDVTDQTDSECLDHYICWYNADSLQDKFDIDLGDSQNRNNVFHKYSQVASTYQNSLPAEADAMNMEARMEADEKNYSNDRCKLGSNKQSRKRKLCNNYDGVPNNKRAINVLNHEEKVEKNGFRGWRVNANIVKTELHSVTNKEQEVKCAVCGISVINTEWYTHIASSHDYIAWQEGETPVNLKDEDAIRNHLHHIVQELGQLQCGKCGLSRKYAKAFLHHIKICYCSSDRKDDQQIPYHLSKIIKVPSVISCGHCGYECRGGEEYAAHVKRCSRISRLYTQNSNQSDDENDDVSKNVTCGVCKEEVMSQQWITHIQQKHNYQAWREGDTPLDIENEESIRKHLYIVLQKHGPLVCSKCGLSRKYVKLFLQHIGNCTGPKENLHPLDTFHAEWESVLDTSLDDSEIESTNVVKCGRCHLEMESKQWIDHIQKMHNYLSWQEGKTPLDTSDVEAVRRYLNVVVQKLRLLVCAKCGVARKYVKNYLTHIGHCMRPLDSDANGTNNTAINLRQSIEVESSLHEDIPSPQLDTALPLPALAAQVPQVTSIKCGVCQKEMPERNWFSHIGMNHEYVAWKETDLPIDLSNYEAIWQHLTDMIKDNGALKCAECGKKCKFAKGYLLHIKACYGKTYVEIDGGNSTLNDSAIEMDATLDTTSIDEEDKESRTVRCGVCSEEMNARLWIDHIQKQHNYLAWRDGDTALDLKNEESVQNHLKSVMRKIKRLTCAKCGLRRKKVLPFYTHIKTCDGTVESSDEPLKTLKPKLEVNEVLIKCAVCQSEISDSLWIEHIAKEHEYMAWKCGEEPLNFDDETIVKDHLYKISQSAGELICSTCGKSRKYVKSYLQHIRGCTGPEESTNDTFKTPKPKRESTELVTCALCRLELVESMWMEHIAKEHNYVAWKQNDPPLVFTNAKSLRDHLYSIVQSIGSLVCNKCGLVRKYAKSYLLHIETCQRITWRTINTITMKLKKEKGDIVRCAVCGADVDDTQWLEHIASQHNYLAWRDRDPAPDLENENGVIKHLKSIIQSEGTIKCPKCKLPRKYAKLYLQHVNTCDGTGEDNVEINDSLNDSEPPSDSNEVDDLDSSKVVKCGVCAQQVAKSAWLVHIQKEHKYLAWEEGNDPLDLNDKDAVYNHLNAINAKCKGLTCDSCGVVRKYVKAYQHHVRDCSERNFVGSNEIIECGVCGDKLVGKLWRDHAMETHYNIAWVAGDTPIDVRNFFCVDKYLKEYQEYKHKLVCNICGLPRASLAGFYAHILICGKTDEEIDAWKDVCNVCNQKYLCIYKTQHYWAHRVQDVAKERKCQYMLKNEEDLSDELNCTPGRRRAAEKARSVIRDYASKFPTNKCKSCPFETDSKEELASHRCGKRAMMSNEDSDDSVSIKLEDYSEEESDDQDVDSDLSNEEEESIASEKNPVKKKNIKNDTTGGKISTKTSKFPFEVKNVRPYLQESKADYFKLFYTRETLFTDWRDSNYEVLSEEFLPQYMPQLKESCKVSISNGGWTTYKRFESRMENGCKVFFTGGSIQCIAWAPEHPDSTAACRSLLAVATHRGPDCPRLVSTDTPSHPALIQIWDFDIFKSLPKFAFGLAHDYGTVWAMDWCPSGARDLSDRIALEDNYPPRLGLLAMACSNGSAYIVSVPHPNRNKTSDVTFYKIKPCVELRITRERIKYQATSVNWTLFKGYTTITVGYGDGTVAFYDLASESPLLTAKEGDINILYPFQDERVHNSCVTGLTSSLLGAWCSSSVTGSMAGVSEAEPRAGRGAHPLRAHSALSAGAATFMPHWPNVLLSGDDTIVGLSPSELEWGYVGRRVGNLRALAPCLHRARVAAVVPPLLQAMRPHPAAFKGHKTIHKKNVAMIEMTPLAKKRSKQSNDELSMKVEPITYEDAIKSYGVEFKFERDFDKPFINRMQQKHRVPFPERFPLADVPALAYCPAAAHYTKLALATHSGLVLLFDV